MKLRWLVVLIACTACHSPGPYGYSRAYSPLDAEEDAVEKAVELDPVMIERVPEEWKNKTVTLFGVVRGRKEASSGQAYLTLSMRRLADRNLCGAADEETCRVTVSDREHAIVHVIAKLTGEDDLGKTAVGPGSLVRVVGRLRDEVNPEDGAPVLAATYYRHWPRGEFVTDADSEHMRR